MDKKIRRFYTIDGNPANAETIVGYCKHHHGCVTKAMMDRKACIAKGCHYFIRFEYEDEIIGGRGKHPTGDAYRESLKKRKK